MHYQYHCRYDPDHKESLLAPSQSQKSASVISNIALACNVAGNCDLQVSDQDLHDTIDLIAKNLKLEGPSRDISEGPPFVGAGHPLFLIENALRFGGQCHRCRRLYRVLFATPCGCLTCVDCTSTARIMCSHCKTLFVMHSCQDESRKKDNPNPKWDVPRQLIEWQPAYTQRGASGGGGGEWQPNWSQTDSTKCDYLVKKLLDINALPIRHTWNLEGTCIPTNCTQPKTKFQFRDDASSIDQPPPKAIVFTQFWHHILLIERSLENASAAQYFAMYRKQMSQQLKALELSRFQKDKNCRVLIMDESGALGLDLSFVNYMFLMEPISNKSLEDQVISRAHRMGARRDVHVEIIAMKGSIEEMLLHRMDSGTGKTMLRMNIGYMDTPALASVDMPPKWSDGAKEQRERQEAAKRANRNKLLVSLKPVN